MSVSLASMVAAFVTMGIVFTLGLLLLGFLRTGATGTVSLKAIPPSKPNAAPQPTQLAAAKTVEEVAAGDVSALLSGLAVGDSLALVFYSNGCPWCRRFKTDTLAELEGAGTLPLPVRLVQANADLKGAIDKDTTLRTLATQVKGLPTSLVLLKRDDGLYYHTLVGFLPSDSFLKKLDEAETAATKV